MDDSLALVTFIGGSANLTQRVLQQRELGPYFDVAVMPDIREYGPGYEPMRVVANRERYILKQVARSHFVALIESIR